ncbi:MAG: sugar transferase [Acidobacteria bacterium]|nr:MAG: sugar transferase [Acidobacteriota bacterium]
MLNRQIRKSQLTLLASDTAAVLVGVQAAVFLGTGQYILLPRGFKSIAVGYCFFLVVLFYITDLYNLRRDQHSDEIASLVVLDSAIAAAFLTLSFYFYPRWSFGRSFFVSLFLLTPGLVMIGRLTWAYLRGTLARPSTVAVFGDGPAFKELETVAREHRLKVVNLSVATCVPLSSSTQGRTMPLRDGSDELRDLMASLQPDIIVLEPLASLDPSTARVLIDARFSGVAVLDFPTAFQMLSGKLPLNHMDGQWFLSAQGFQYFGSNIAVRVKRLLDVGLAFVLCLIAAPMLPLIALGIRVSSKGPALYIQERVGRNGQVFPLFKFRTMPVGADREGPWTLKNDPRVFPFGRFLRITRLDELPQLVNVLRGDMSFVGPRPESLVLVDLYQQEIPYYNLRSAVRPGITGWAQINYPYGSSVKDAVEKLKYDLHYIQHLSILFDIQIVLRTIRTVLARQGSQ